MNILQRLSEIHELPTLAEITLRIQTIVTSDDGDANALARIIEQDPALSAKILKIANSSFYGIVGPRISNVKYAITRIGFNEVGHIALAVSIIKKFSRHSSVLDHKQFWRHSLTAGYLANAVADASGIEFTPRMRHALFLAGLLHDIGILIYDQFFHEEFEIIIDHALKCETSYLEAEQAAAPRETHSLLGSALLELWRLDAPVISGVRFHHAVDRAPEKDRPIAAAAYLAEYLLCNSGLGSFEGLINQGNKSILEYLQIRPESLADFLEQVEIEVNHSDLMFALETTENDSMQLRAV